MPYDKRLNCGGDYVEKSWNGCKVKAELLCTYLVTYLLQGAERVLLEKLTGFQLVKKFPAFYGTRRYITAVTSVRHLSLS